MRRRPRRTSLRARIALGIGSLSTAVVAVAFLALQARESTVQRGILEDHIQHQSQLIIEGLEHTMLAGIEDERHSLANEMIRGLVSHPEVSRIEILDKEGVIKVSSEPSRVGLMLLPTEKACRSCHAHSPEERGRFLWSKAEDGSPLLVHAAPIRNKRACQQCHDAAASLNGILLASFSPSAGVLDARGDWLLLLAALVLGGGLTGLCAFCLVDVLVTRRLGRVSERIRRLPEASSDDGPQGQDEIEQLEATFENMVDSLETERLQVIRQEKLATLGELAGSVAHEINNPVGIIRSQVDCLEMEFSDLEVPAVVREDLAVMKRQLGRIASTVSGLLSFARRAPATFDSVDLKQLVHDLLSWATPQFKSAGVRIAFACDGEQACVWGNGEQLTQVVLNLLTNARDSMPSGGVVRLEIRHAPDGLLRILVSDQGSGIPEEARDRVFEPFFTTKGQGKGTGLGLSVCQRIISEHGGSLSLACSGPEGSSFVVELAEAAAQESMAVEDGP